jgi:hypothetical protein
MGIFEYLIALAASAPAIALWIAVIIYGAIKLNRGGGRAERFLIAGGSVKLAGNLLVIPTFFFVPWLFHQGYSTDYISAVSNGYAIFRNLISMAGLLCLLYAFWVKFNVKKEVEIPS